VKAADAELLGISGDHTWAHKAYAEKLGGLPFPLLADWGMGVVKQYGVHNPARNVPKRAVFVLDREGIVRFKNTAFDARNLGHYAEVLEKLAELP
jgi:peroxiredoxin